MSLIERAMTSEADVAARKARQEQVALQRQEQQRRSLALRQKEHVRSRIYHYLRKHFKLSRKDANSSIGETIVTHTDVSGNGCGYADITLPELPGRLRVFHSGNADNFQLSCEHCGEIVGKSEILKSNVGEQLAALGRVIKLYERHTCK